MNQPSAEFMYAITGYRQDEEGHWVAILDCGHTQHVRHDPPWESRFWVLTPEGRAGMLGQKLNCKKCFYKEPLPSPNSESDSPVDS